MFIALALLAATTGASDFTQNRFQDEPSATVQTIDRQGRSMRNATFVALVPGTLLVTHVNNLPSEIHGLHIDSKTTA